MLLIFGAELNDPILEMDERNGQDFNHHRKGWTEHCRRLSMVCFSDGFKEIK